MTLADANTNGFPLLSVFRGMYQRVAAKVGVDPSFVSRVARGERRSPAVLAALREEMSVIREHLNKIDESLGATRQLDGLQKDGKSSDGELVDGHLRDGHVRDGRANGNVGDFADGQRKDGHAGATFRDGQQAQGKQGKPNHKSIKLRQNKTKRNDGARAAE